jgi:hypothetical protein
MDRFGKALQIVGLKNPIINPFRTKTKGEVLASVSDIEIIEQLLRVSLSCSHAESLRYSRIPPKHCGYCFPCLIRRASIHAASVEDRTKYAFDVLSNKRFLDVNLGRAADLQAVFSSLKRPPGRFEVLRNGPVASADVAAFTDVYRRGRDELRSWLSQEGSISVKAAVAP